ncbi:RecQ family ATP-dependent DNA helicase [Nostoc ellipsosporum NOK]|nr:RecQ family ATP-dependent DNA helicase [Nostoc ellipsosporum NOK]
MTLIAFIDIEVSLDGKKIFDMGCALSDQSTFAENNLPGLNKFVEKADFICGHNILAHDLVYLRRELGNPGWAAGKAIDTLLLSPLLFPQNPYHRLVKDDKLDQEHRNNPLNDALKARDLFFDEVAAFNKLEIGFKDILYHLLSSCEGFDSFFKYIGYSPGTNAAQLAATIRKLFENKICSAFDLDFFIETKPVALAYALALLHADNRFSITPPWVLKNYPDVEKLVFLMRNNPCAPGCIYCKQALNPIIALEKNFGFQSFRKYGGEPLQEDAVNAAIRGQSILAVFPTGGGKSLTFQVPALMSGANARALTVVISPLQSLMKDQVDNLEKNGIVEAATINGLLDPIERSKAIERVASGMVSLLYIAPESLRSITIERLLLKRKIARFVIDEAHCFSAWGQDFRVDYLYIGDFIKNLQHQKGLDYKIPVSCFTATAKQQVIEDIKLYFKEKLDLTLDVFRASVSRTNLHYDVTRKETEEDKYNQLRDIVESKDCPTIIYVSRTKRADKLAKRLNDDGFVARAYHGKMERDEKSANQNGFMSGEIKIMVATSAFGMGVDKKNVGAVIHYDISDSLENYVQEAGRAGRDEKIEADCYILFNEDDLDAHFTLLNQSKISSKEINQIWRAIKDLTRSQMSRSALEIARKAGWDDSIKDMETRVKTAVAALEDAGYLRRRQNQPRIYANSILSKNAQEAIDKINKSEKIPAAHKEKAARIIKKLFSSKSKRLSTDEMAESRIDYISDQLGIVKAEVIRLVELMREEKILADTKDLTAYIRRTENVNKSLLIVENFRKQEELLLTYLKDDESGYHLKEIVAFFLKSDLKSCTVTTLKTILNFWAIKNWIRQQNLEHSRNHVKINFLIEKDVFRDKQEKRYLFARLITEYLYKKLAALSPNDAEQEELLIEFSVQELKEMIDAGQGLFTIKASVEDIEDSLFYLSRIGAIRIDGGFLVVHNKLKIERLETNNRIKYKESDYEKLNHFYQQKAQQIHIVGEYAKKMMRNYQEALKFVDDYFSLNYASFLTKYFPGSRQDEIKRTLTPEKFMRLFGALSPTQLQIINDSASQHIIVAAGPGSGKTRVLVHKLASLLLTEDVKHEQLLMLTFSRAAATEFKKRLIELIGKAAHFVEIKTFHSYCFDLLDRIGSLVDAENIIKIAVEKIKSGEPELFKITKTVLVVDEAQDMNKDEHALINALMERNEGMRTILVGDDDQNIYEFRGADTTYLQTMIQEGSAVKYELTENYRSKDNIVSFSNSWVATIKNRLKVAPSFARQQQNGTINITRYKNSNLIVPVSEAIQKAELSGSTCILTQTNEEAALLVGILSRLGVQAKLIQSNDSFPLINLDELHYFSEIIKKEDQSPIINDEDWLYAKHQMNARFGSSTKKELANAVIQAFEQISSVKKYKSDWNAFLLESKIEDFIRIDAEIIYVSTIHKAKGKEFDNLYLVLKSFAPVTDLDKRLFYVAITRAKTNLSIHYYGNYLKDFVIDSVNYEENNNTYSDPLQIVLYLGHKDVQLWFFENNQHRINNLVSGSRLTVLKDGLGNERGEIVLKFSQKFREEKLKGYINKGFSLVAAKVDFIVYWKNDKSDQEARILLPQLLLKRK